MRRETLGICPSGPRPQAIFLNIFRLGRLGRSHIRTESGGLFAVGAALGDMVRKPGNNAAGNSGHMP